MRRLIILAIVGAIFLLMVTKSFAVPLELKDAKGTSFTFSAPPKKIVSLAPSITESLYLLGVQDSIAGVTIFADVPPEVKEKEKIGTILNPSIEKIVSLNPDLVLISQEGNRPQTMDKLRRLGIKVFVLGESENFSDIEEHFLVLGKIVGQEKRALQVMELVSGRIAEVRSKVSSLPPVKVFWQVGTNPLITVAEGTFLDAMIQMAGGINIAHQAKIRYPHYSREAVVKENPQVIFLATMGDELANRQEEEWRRFRQLKARICRINPNVVCRPVPLSFVKGLEEIARLLHPEAFKQ